MLLNDMEGMEVRTPSKFDMEDMKMEMKARMAPSKFDFEDMESRSPAASSFEGVSFTCKFSRTKYNFEDAKFNEEYEVDDYEIIGD